MTEKQPNFIQRIIDEDNLSEKFDKRVHTRFPPEPNGYLHIGHAKAICLNFNIANEFGKQLKSKFNVGIVPGFVLVNTEGKEILKRTGKVPSLEKIVECMTQVTVGENEGIESALRRFKRQVSKAGIFG